MLRVGCGVSVGPGVCVIKGVGVGPGVNIVGLGVIVGGTVLVAAGTGVSVSRITCIAQARLEQAHASSSTTQK